MNNTKIEWTDVSWNPVSGCKSVSEGCRHCYARTMAERFQGKAFPHGFDIHMRPHKLAEPCRLKPGTKVFVNSMSDLYWSEIPDSYRSQVFDVMESTPGITYQVLTKRPDNALRYSCRRELPPNVWLGVTVESQRWTSRIDTIRQVPASTYFLSAEPLLGPLDLDLEGIDWVITGGESGVHLHNPDICAKRGLVANGTWLATPEKAAWVRSIRDQCQAADVAFFFKQWGGPRPKPAGSVLDGRQHKAFPAKHMEG